MDDDELRCHCGGAVITTEKTQWFPYGQGHDAMMLEAVVPVHRCKVCDGTFTSHTAEQPKADAANVWHATNTVIKEAKAAHERVADCVSTLTVDELVETVLTMESMAAIYEYKLRRANEALRAQLTVSAQLLGALDVAKRACTDLVSSITRTFEEAEKVDNLD